jgi:hypothetical protein
MHALKTGKISSSCRNRTPIPQSSTRSPATILTQFFSCILLSSVVDFPLCTSLYSLAPVPHLISFYTTDHFKYESWNIWWTALRNENCYQEKIKVRIYSDNVDIMQLRIFCFSMYNCKKSKCTNYNFTCTDAKRGLSHSRKTFWVW